MGELRNKKTESKWTRPGAKQKKSNGQSFEIGLIDRVRSGERDSFYELTRPYLSSLYATALAILKNEADGQEAVQDTLLKALTHLGRFRREAKFSTWLIQIAINEARMRLRKNRRRAYESLDDGSSRDDDAYRPRDFADWREIPSEALERKELRSALRRAVENLAPIYRRVLLLRDIQHLSTAEASRVLSISEVAVKSRLLRARLQVRDALAPGIDGAWSLGETKWRKIRPW